MHIYGNNFIAGVVFLSDDVEGGHLNFTALGISKSSYCLLLCISYSIICFIILLLLLLLTIDCSCYAVKRINILYTYYIHHYLMRFFYLLVYLAVKPALGRLVVWAVAQDSNVTTADKRTEHIHMPVEKGNKVLATLDIHLGDYRTTTRWKC